MYNTRIFYDKHDGTILHNHTKTSGVPLSLNDDLNIVSESTNIPVEQIGVFEWDIPENELETIIAEEKVPKIDISQTPPVLYGEEPEIIEPSDDDEIGGREFLNKVEGVM